MSADLPGYARAQAELESRLPPEDGPSDCAACNGHGQVPVPGDPEAEYVECGACDGFGQVTANGDPFDYEKTKREEAEYADHKRNERDTEPQQ